LPFLVLPLSLLRAFPAALDKIPHHDLSFFMRGKSICIEGNYQSWLSFFVLFLASLAQQ